MGTNPETLGLNLFLHVGETCLTDLSTNSRVDLEILVKIRVPNLGKRDLAGKTVSRENLVQVGHSDLSCFSGDSCCHLRRKVPLVGFKIGGVKYLLGLSGQEILTARTSP
ncbi:hypothetical protein M0802_014071 [Mischocyttarus mexicanus]|nr:hypothetical protein M0802_014071 [Mischocyttarus mexicanus]